MANGSSGAGKWSFWLGVGVTLAVIGIVVLGGWIVAGRKTQPLLVTSERIDLTGMMQNDPLTFWSLKPNLDKVEFKAQEGQNPFRVTTNDLGLRNAPVGEKGDRFRILAIGDSTTFGQYVEDNETWPAQLQAVLDKDARDIEVINAGLIGATSFQGLAYLSRRGIDLKPDLVIATYSFNDRGAWQYGDRQFSRRSRNPFGRLVASALGGLGLAPSPKSENRYRVSPGEFLDTLIAMREFCASREVALFLVVWPDPDEIANVAETAGPPSYASLTREAARRTSSGSLGESLRKGTPVVDLTEPFRKAGVPVLLDAIHANPTGCHIAAESMAKRIREEFERGMGSAWVEKRLDAIAALENGSDLPGALSRCQRLLELGVTPPEVLIRTGNLLARKGDVDGAIGLLKKAIGEDTQSRPAYEALDAVLIGLPDATRRVAVWRDAVHDHPDAGFAHCSLGAALESVPDLEGAVQEYRAACALRTKDASLLVCLGIVLVRQGAFAQAVAAFRSALEISPDSTDPRLRTQLVVALCETGDYAGAGQAVEACRRLGVSLPEDVVKKAAGPNGPLPPH